MATRVKANLHWQASVLCPGTGATVRRRLQGHSEELRQLLDMPEEPPITGEDDSEREIDAVISDLVGVYVRCILMLRDVDRTASEAKQRANLHELLNKGDFSRSTLEDLDPATQNRVLSYHPLGALALYSDKLGDEAIREGVLRALKDLGPRKPGRPRGTESLALRQCALGLAAAYAKWRESPTRRGRLGGPVYGPFKDFVSFVLGLLPDRFRRYQSGGQKKADYVVQLAIEEYERAQEAYIATGNPSRLWTIDDAHYLEPAK